MSLPNSAVERGREALIALRIDDAIRAFEEALEHDPGAIAAHLGLYEALQVKGERSRAVEHQRAALERQQLYLEKAAAPGVPVMLVVAVPGDWQANVPLEYAYSSLTLGIYKFFAIGNLPQPKQLPPRDVVFNAVAHSDAAEATLGELEGWLPRFGVPVLNDPSRVVRLSRDRVAREYADLSGAFFPPTRRVRRDELARELLPNAVTLRPIDSQAGSGFARIERPDELAAYLAESRAEEYFVAQFVDYRSSDGFFRKYRIIFVDGTPYPHHLAISDRWMVHYYNARNDEHAWMRDEEARFLAEIETVFDGPRAAALGEIARRVGLDYFGIDCGVLPDGRVIVFEIDVAMIVHLGDPIEKYPYKHEYVPRIFRALERMVRARVGAIKA